MADHSPEDPQDPARVDVPRTGRRTFLARATVALGGLIGAAITFPLARYFLFPVGRRIVQTDGEPIDVIGLDELLDGGAPRKVVVVADGVRDAWGVADRVPLGSAWLQRTGDEITCLSSVCPHLGCAIDYDPKDELFRCPCHKSEFARTGAKITGPSKRGLDPLEVVLDRDRGRIKLLWRRFKADIAEREEV